MRIKMVSNGSQVYGGKRLKDGEHFEVRGESDARLFRALKMATDAPPPVPAPPPYIPPTRSYVRKIVTPADAENADAPAVKTTRRYQRRDLTATED
jgi:hypothetical protein